jgi:hypothetical protein
MRALKPSPGPGEYVYENSEFYKKNKSFIKENSAAFGIDENRKIETVDKVQIPQVDNPGPGQYDTLEKQKKRAQLFTSNFMS